MKPSEWANGRARVPQGWLPAAEPLALIRIEPRAGRGLGSGRDGSTVSMRIVEVEPFALSSRAMIEVVMMSSSVDDCDATIAARFDPLCRQLP